MRPIASPLLRKKGGEAQARLAAIVQYSDDAIVRKTLEGRDHLVEPSGHRACSATSRGRSVDRSMTIIIPEDRLSEEDPVLSAIRRGEVIDHFETIRKRKDGTLIPISLTVFSVKNTVGTIIGISKIARPISVRKAMNAARAALDAQRAREAGFDAQLVKPAHPDRLVAMLPTVPRELDPSP